MGDGSRYEYCDRFVTEFGDDIISLYKNSLGLLTADYYLGVDDYHISVWMYADIPVGMENIRVKVDEMFYEPEMDNSDLIDYLSGLLKIDEDIIEKRLRKAAII